MRSIRPGSDRDRLGLAADVADLRRGADELVVRHHRRALEGEITIDLDPRAAAVILVADADGDRARDPVDPQEQDVKRIAALPAQALVSVVLRPHVEGGEAVDDARVARLEVVGHLRPRADAHPIGLRDAAVLEQRPRRRLLVRPHPLLERAAQLGVVRLANEVVALMVEGRIEEETVVLELEVLVLLTDAALAEGYELLTLGQGAHRHGPLFEGNRHYSSRSDRVKRAFAAPAIARNGIGWPAKARHSRTAWPNLQICGSC